MHFIVGNAEACGRSSSSQPQEVEAANVTSKYGCSNLEMMSDECVDVSFTLDFTSILCISPPSNNDMLSKIINSDRSINVIDDL